MRVKLLVVLALALAVLACTEEPPETRTVSPGTPRVFVPSTATPVAPDTAPSSSDNVPSPTDKAPVPTNTVPPAIDKAPVPTDTPPTSPGQPKEEPVVLPENVDGYLALAPAQLRSGQLEGISVSLFQGQHPAKGDVEVALMRGGNPVAKAQEVIEGSGTVSIQLPRVSPGRYAISVSGKGFRHVAQVQVVDTKALFLETDKPIYKPGQNIHIRVLLLDAELKPLSGEVTIEMQDAKGIKVFKQQATSDDFGMVNLEMPLSTEPNLGVWKLTARSGDQTTQIDVRVEEYVLPKYEVTVETSKDWVLANEPVKGTVSAEYSFGKPVRGEVEIVASRYVGVWEEFATFTQEIDGSGSFELPAVGYVSGVPASGGQGNLTLNITVREKSTGYVESTTRLLTVAESPLKLQVIPEGLAFKPSLPFSFLVVTETPGNEPVDREVSVAVDYWGEDLQSLGRRTHRITTDRGKALLQIDPPEDAVALVLEAESEGAWARINLQASYSPSGNFIHVEQSGDALLSVGATARFGVASTIEGRNTYYEVISRGKVVFSDFTRTRDISFQLTPVMAPASRLVVYQILPNNEVAADYIPFDVSARYPMDLTLDFSKDEVSPGEAVNIEVGSQGPAKVGLAAVDRSVFILAENRVNLHQVFAELERLYMQPQAELHEFRPFGGSVVTRGAEETFQDAGLVVMSSMNVPQGKKFNEPRRIMRRGGGGGGGGFVLAVPTPSPAATSAQASEELAEVQRVRQFFPETWLWADVMTDEEGRATLPVEAPDSITTWMLRGVALSKEHGLGIAEAELRVFQPFFVQVDLPFSAVRGEEFPVKIALYNYLDSPQEFFVELEQSDDFDLLDDRTKTVSVAANDVSGLEFKIRLTELGNVPVKVVARSRDSADAIVKDLLVEPEGVPHEQVDNMVLSPGDSRTLPNAAPPGAIPGSARTQVALTGSYLSQTIEGLEGLLRMPFGCGEQNMILFAPNVFVAKYLEKTGQIKPEVMAKAEHLMITGYQRELTYRRNDGSFSAFGQSDQDGSLWLTAFVLKTFAQAKDLVYIDDDVLNGAMEWVVRHQRRDGSFEPVGFLHHQELLGGLKGNTALTAYVAIALLEAGETSGASAAVRYLEDQLERIDDPYTMAIVAYALALADSGSAGNAHQKLMSMSIQDENGLHWGGKPAVAKRKPVPGPGSNTAVETTGYATLALMQYGDRANAASAARWLVSQRNAFGGFGSTQDTVVGLQALIEFAAAAKFDVDMAVTLRSGDWTKVVRVNEANADVAQVLDVPIGGSLRMSAKGSGEVLVQVVRRFNRPEVDRPQTEMFQIDVNYDADRIEVDDLITVTAEVEFTPPVPLEAGMVVLDVSIPTGFAPVTETVRALVEEDLRIKRYEVAGRKVILYIEDLLPNRPMRMQFDAVALYPVRAQPVVSQVYSYYTPGWKGASLSRSVTVDSR